MLLPLPSLLGSPLLLPHSARAARPRPFSTPHLPPSVSPRRTRPFSHLQLQQPSQPAQFRQPHQPPEPLFTGVWLSGVPHQAGVQRGKLERWRTGRPGREEQTPTHLKSQEVCAHLFRGGSSPSALALSLGGHSHTWWCDLPLDFLCVCSHFHPPLPLSFLNTGIVSNDPPILDQKANPAVFQE